jgi:hypothetical protein
LLELVVAAAAGAAAGVLLLPSLELELAGEEAEFDVPDAGFLAEEYRSAYHPPPLNDTAGAVSTRSSVPLQCGQIVISGSENFWIFSMCFLQVVHSYS